MVFNSCRGVSFGAQSGAGFRSELMQVSHLLAVLSGVALRVMTAGRERFPQAALTSHRKPKRGERSMNPMKSILFAALLMLAPPLLAQGGPVNPDSATAATAAVPDVPEIAPAPAGKGDCERCKKMGTGGMSCCKGMQRSGCKMAHGGGTGGCEKCEHMGGKMAHGHGMSGMGGMGCCGGMRGGDSGDTAAFERRISELEKRLDLMQQLLQQPRKAR
jgi:hypothetical protein